MKQNSLFTGILLALMLAGVLLACGCTGSDDSHVVQSTAISTLTATVTPTPVQTAPTGTGTAGPVTFSGTGNDTISSNLSAGVYKVTFTQSVPDTTHFSVRTKTMETDVRNSYAELVQSSAETPTGWVWSYAFETDENPVIVVNTSGEWTAVFDYPQMINGIPPLSFNGTGNMATPYFMLYEGNVSFAIDTVSNTFIEATLLDTTGAEVMNATNAYAMPLPGHRGTYNGTIVVPLEKSGNYLLNVVCDGEWSVHVTDDRS